VKISKRRLSALLTPIVALLLAFAFVNAPSAAASTDIPRYSITGSATWFHAAGDHVFVEDTDADGYTALARVQVAYDGVYSNVWCPGGSGTTCDGNFDFTEQKTIGIEPCVGVWNGGINPVVVSCAAAYRLGVT
jgi:hypothetical protein